MIRVEDKMKLTVRQLRSLIVEEVQSIRPADLQTTTAEEIIDDLRTLIATEDDPKKVKMYVNALRKWLDKMQQV